MSLNTLGGPIAGLGAALSGFDSGLERGIETQSQAKTAAANAAEAQARAQYFQGRNQATQNVATTNANARLGAAGIHSQQDVEVARGNAQSKAYMAGLPMSQQELEATYPDYDPVIYGAAPQSAPSPQTGAAPMPNSRTSITPYISAPTPGSNAPGSAPMPTASTPPGSPSLAMNRIVVQPGQEQPANVWTPDASRIINNAPNPNAPQVPVIPPQVQQLPFKDRPAAAKDYMQSLIDASQFTNPNTQSDLLSPFYGMGIRTEPLPGQEVGKSYIPGPYVGKPQDAPEYTAIPRYAPALGLSQTDQDKLDDLQAQALQRTAAGAASNAMAGLRQAQTKEIVPLAQAKIGFEHALTTQANSTPQYRQYMEQIASGKLTIAQDNLADRTAMIGPTLQSMGVKDQASMELINHMINQDNGGDFTKAVSALAVASHALNDPLTPQQDLQNYRDVADNASALIKSRLSSQSKTTTQTTDQNGQTIRPFPVVTPSGIPGSAVPHPNVPYAPPVHPAIARTAYSAMSGSQGQHVTYNGKQYSAVPEGHYLKLFNQDGSYSGHYITRK